MRVMSIRPRILDQFTQITKKLVFCLICRSIAVQYWFYLLWFCNICLRFLTSAAEEVVRL